MTSHQKADYQAKDYQKTIPCDDVIDLTHSEGLVDKEVPSNQKVKTPSNDEGMEK